MKLVLSLNEVFWKSLNLPQRYVGVIWFGCFSCSPNSTGLDSHNKTRVALVNLQ